MISNKVILLLSFLFFAGFLTGCAGTEPLMQEGGATASAVKPSAPLPKPASNADVLYGETHDNLATIRTMYDNTPQDDLMIARYGKALRESGDLKKAKSILLPVSESKKSGTLANTELAAIYLSEGDFEKAEIVSRKAIKQDEANYRAWRNLGNALDAQEKYKDGETAFRRSLELWRGNDKVPVMNNLALNLAAQGFTDQALTLLYQAQKLDPDRVEIERNIRIIRTLSEPPKFAGNKYPLPESKLPE